jgi:aspartyl/asparaginyl beta-hydroxylase (cupin superfamily)
VHDRERFSWTADLEAGAPVILAELDGLLASRRGFSEVYKQHTSTGSWAAAYFWVFGRKMDATCEACPETARILESIPGVTTFSTALFSALAPGTNVTPHCGLTNAKLRCQLPLRVPDRCGLRIADREIRLTAGECVVFDDSFLHSAWNMSDRPRFVLLFDFFHPDLTPAEIEHLLEVSAAGKTQSGYMQQLEPARNPDWVYG